MYVIWNMDSPNYASSIILTLENTMFQATIKISNKCHVLNSDFQISNPARIRWNSATPLVFPNKIFVEEKTKFRNLQTWWMIAWLLVNSIVRGREITTTLSGYHKPRFFRCYSSIRDFRKWGYPKFAALHKSIIKGKLNFRIKWRGRDIILTPPHCHPLFWWMRCRVNLFWKVHHLRASQIFAILLRNDGSL